RAADRRDRDRGEGDPPARGRSALALPGERRAAPRERRLETPLPLPGSPAPGARGDAGAAPPRGDGGAGVSLVRELPRDRDTGAGQAHARGCPRLHRAESCPSREVLRAAPVAAALQADADDLGLRPLLPVRALPPRRGPAR